ncbi:MAG: hypothetical protein H6819_09415 [Phycisphaerales bacterium]|nr:hypothetical protein [Phycisphaerales bacterium]MCB9855430.1 hypothetical protein [Phycisphaerales bacterium]
MRRYNIRKDDQEAVMREIGPILPILREAVDEGFYCFCRSRDADPAGFVDYTEATRANMLCDRISTSLRELVDLMRDNYPDLDWRITPNKRATEVFLDTRLAFRIKRAKSNRGGCTTNVKTSRQRAIKSNVMLPYGQMVMPFPANQIEVADTERIWITTAFDLDEFEEAIDRVSVGVEMMHRFLWKRPLPVFELGVIADLSHLLADKIDDMRQRRSA